MFKDVIGHEDIKQRLITSLRTGRISHAQLFAGETGYGSLALALAFAQYVFCTGDKKEDACGECPSCKKIQKYIHPDLHFVFPVVRKTKSPVSDEYINEWRRLLMRTNYFGLEESEKLLFLAIVTGETWKKLRRGLITKMLIDVPGTGVSFIVPLSSVGGRKTLQFLVNEQEFEKEEETSMKDTDYELLVAIANQGYIDTVMDAARSAKAGGGTVIHAKGTGMELAKKYLGVSLVEEKEVILIVTKSREKNQIMKAIMEQAGLDSKERTIVFSLPVTSVAGIRMLEEDIQDDLL